MAYKEIVTKAVIAKGKKKYINNYEIEVEEEPSTILGCWIINHNFEAHEERENIKISGSFDANIWYSYDNDTKTKVVNKKIVYEELEKLNIPVVDNTSKDIIIRSLKQPSCISAKEDGKIIKIEVEKELGIEVVGDTKVKISSVDDTGDEWDDLTDNLKQENEIDKINQNYLKEENIK